MKEQIIAFYLPQYHPTPNNNKWWGTGFTEWTNVAKAKPLFKGHDQPKIPADLGFYDLRLPEVREHQVELAKEAGVRGFCYYHYWFGNGEQELERPFNEVVKSGEPDFPFCLCWANESWYKKMWNKDSSMRVMESKLLAEQKYLGEGDNQLHFNTLLDAFKDSRYIRVDDRLLFLIYKPLTFVNIKEFISQWNELALQAGLKGFYFVGFSFDIENEYDKIKALGFDGVCSCRLNRTPKRNLIWAYRKIVSMLFRRPRCEEYRSAIQRLVTDVEKKEDVYPTIIPNWDHTPRSGYNGGVFVNSTPALFQAHAEDALSIISDKKDENKLIFLKSWNEWGEGNYMEPDLKFGKGYIKALKAAIENYKSKKI